MEVEVEVEVGYEVSDKEVDVDGYGVDWNGGMLE